MFKHLYLVPILTLVVLTSSFYVTTSKETQTSSFKTDRVIILVIDGPRYSETFGDSTFKYIPHLGKELRKEGTLISNFSNNGPTLTISGHAAIITGRYQKLSNTGKQLPKYPSIFQYFLKEKDISKSNAWVLSSKGKLEVLGNTTYKKWWNMYPPYTYCGKNGNGADYTGDAETFAKTLEVLSSENAPKLMLVNLLAADSWGHAGQWERYLQAIQECDEYAYKLWKFIQETPHLKNKTTLFITNDHGRHLDGVKNGFVSHGDGCIGCRKISFLALGPDIKRNATSNKAAEQLDISTTIGKMLNFQVPTSKGRVLEEIFSTTTSDDF